MCGFVFFWRGGGGGYIIYSLTSAGRLWSGSFVVWVLGSGLVQSLLGVLRSPLRGTGL